MNSAHLLLSTRSDATADQPLFRPRTSREWSRWNIVVLFAIAMAWAESAVVFYLRTMIDRIEPYQTNPLPNFGGLAKAELVREAATLVMLFTVGWLAGTTRRQRLAYAFLAFGVWDIFYYVFLKVLTPWPYSLLDWDILFLIPLPWWGPVLAPVVIAALMILWGTLITQFERAPRHLRSNPKAWLLSLPGAGLALYVFMQDSIRVATNGEQALRDLLPTRFDWPLFGVALLLMSLPVLEIIWHCFRSEDGNVPPPATCAHHCKRVHHVQTSAGLKPDRFADANTVGITTGTSTPDESIGEVAQRRKEFDELQGTTGSPRHC